MRRSIPWVAILATTLLTSVVPVSNGAPGPAEDGRPRPVLGPVEVVTTYDFAGGDDYFGEVTAVADRSGVVTASWLEKRTGIRVAQRGADGHWGAPVAISTCVEPACFAFTPRLAVDGNGTVTALWSQVSRNTAQRGMYAASKAQGGAWGAPIRLTGRSCGAGAVAAGRSGSLLVAYSCSPLRVTTLYRAPGTAWAEARRRVFRNAGLPQVGVSDRGTAVLVLVGKHDHLQAHRFGARSGWSAPSRLGAVDQYGAFHLAVGTGGRAAVVWAHPAHRGQVRVRVMGPRGTWHPRVTLSRPGALVDADTYMPPDPRIAVHGKVTVLWSTRRGAIRAATRSLTGRWSTVTAYPKHAGFLLDLSANRRGDLTVLWGHWAFPSARLYAGVFHPSVGWSSRVLVPGRWMGDAPPPDAVGSTLPDGRALVVSTTTDAAPGLDPPLPGTMEVRARTIATGP